MKEREHMDLKPLKIKNLVAKVPIVQGGMGVGISLGGLAGEVAKQGGVGIISSAQIGFKEPDFRSNTLSANLRALGKEYRRARHIAPEGIIGFNIMVALNHYREQVETVAKLGADLIISGAGIPASLPEYVDGYDTAIAPIVSTAKSARILLKIWSKKYNRTADLVVIEGPKAGGHLGFSKEYIEEYDKNFDKEITAIIEIVREYEKIYERHIPVVVAGGISDNSDVLHALELGADGVQIATRFVTTKECDAHENYKRAYINSKADDIMICKSPVGMPGRAIKNEFMERLQSGEKFTPNICLGCLKKCNPREIDYCITERLIMAAEGNVEKGLLFCGANAFKEERITTVQEVIEDLTQSEKSPTSKL